jgi:hypothetical protein
LTRYAFWDAPSIEALVAPGLAAGEQVAAAVPVTSWRPGAAAVAVSDHGRVIVGIAEPPLVQGYSAGALRVPRASDPAGCLVLRELDGQRLVLELDYEADGVLAFADALAAAVSGRVPRP